MPTRQSILPLCILPSLALLFAAPSAFAEESISLFGSRGQVAFDDIVGLASGSSRFGAPLMMPVNAGLGAATYSYYGLIGYAHSTESPMPEDPGTRRSATHTVWLAPSVDVFVRDRLSIGATFAAAYSFGSYEMRNADGQAWHTDGRGYAFTIVPRIGYVIRLGETFALWPRLGFGYSSGYTQYSSEIPGPIEWRAANRSWLAEGELGIVARVHRYIYLRGAPSLRIGSGLYGSTATGGTESFSVRFGVTAGVGILLGG